MTSDAERDKLVKHLGKQIVAVADVAVELEEISNLAKAKEEAEGITAKAIQASQDAMAAHDAMLGELILAQDKVRSAQKDAADLILVAEAKAAELVAKAETRIGGMTAVAKRAVDALKQQLGSLEQKNVDVLAKHAKEEAAARQRIDLILAELAGVQKRLSG